MSVSGAEAGSDPPADAAARGDAPYLDALAAYVAREPLRFHVPGHKGGPGADPQARALFGERAFVYDIPQDIEGIDMGPHPTPYEQAERLAAEAYGAARSWFLTNGATQGNHALCLALARERPVVVQRNSHASIVDGLVLSGGQPYFAAPEYDEDLGMALCVSAPALARALQNAPHAQAAFIVSPTYYGATADIAACAQAAHAAGAALVVDQSWGPHYGFHPDVPESALRLGADAVLTSTHKIVGSLTQSAMLHVADTRRLDQVKLARAVRIMRSTSPSSLLLGSLDGARRQLAARGRELLGETLSLARQAREALDELPGCNIVPGADAAGGWPGVVAWDPMRVVLDVRGTGHRGHALAAGLRRLGSASVWVELATDSLVVAVLGINEPPESLSQLPERLGWLVHNLPLAAPTGPPIRARSAPAGVSAITPRAAWISEAHAVPAEQAVGRISAEAIAGYPPGIPVLLPGERVTDELLAHLRALVLAGVRLHGASDPALETIVVVDERD